MNGHTLLTGQESRDENDPDSPSGRLRGGTDRAVTEVLGAILVFALLVLLIALIQLNAVPAANQQVEFEHNQRVQGDLQSFQTVLSRTASTGADGTVSVEAGTGYPQRFFLFNPPRATGTVALADGGTVTVNNANASGETRDYLGGDAVQFESRTLTYRPNYNEYRGAPTTVYENGVLYNQFDDDRRVVQERGALVNGRTISLVALQGEYSTGSSAPITVGMTPISAPAQEVTVTDDPSRTDPISVTVPTDLSGDEWEELLADESYVTTVQENANGTVSIFFAEDETYTLRMAAVGVGSGFDTDTEPEYIVDVDGNGETVPEGGSQRIVAEVRDQYNNPVSGVTVENTTNLADASVRLVNNDRTDSEGRIALDYRAPTDVDGTANATVTVSFDGNGSERQRARFRLSVLDVDGSGTVTTPTSGGNPINPANVVISEADLVGGQCNTRNDGCVVDITMENRDAANAKEIEQMRLSFYSTDDDFLAPTSVEVRDEPQDGGAITTLTIPDTFRNVALDDLEEAGDAGDTQEYRLSFKNFVRPSPGQGTPTVRNGAVTGDFFILEVRFEDEGTTRDNYVTYFIGAT